MPFLLESDKRIVLCACQGSNHLLFNKNDDIGVEYDTSYAMVAKVGWSNLIYRYARCWFMIDP